MPASVLLGLKVLTRGRSGIVMAPEWLHEELRGYVDAHQAKRARGKKGDRVENGAGRIHGLMQAGCDNGFRVSQAAGFLVSEGRHPTGLVSSPRDVMLLAFKADQYRIYGGFLDRGESQCYLAVLSDTAKQNNKANQALLKRAAKDLGSYLAESGANPLRPGEVWPRVDRNHEHVSFSNVRSKADDC